MKIFSGSSSKNFTQSICSYLGVTQGLVERETFPDGESWCQFQENIRGEDVYIVQSTSAPVNNHLMELLVMGDAARRASAGKLTAVIPFMGYMRQDRKDKPRVPITAKLVMNMLECAGFSRIISMDVHTMQAQGFTDLPFDHLFGFPLFARAILAQGVPVENIVIGTPDIGGLKRAMAYADALHCEVAIVNKKRKSATKVTVENVIGDVEGKHVYMVDDMTETAGTIVAGATAFKEHGAIAVTPVITHNALNNKGMTAITSALGRGIITEMLTTDTIDRNESQSYADIQGAGELFGEAMVRCSRNESITELFDVKGF